MKLLFLLGITGAIAGRSLNVKRMRRLYPKMEFKMLRRIISQGPRQICLEYKLLVDGFEDLRCRNGRKYISTDLVEAREMNQLFGRIFEQK